MQILALNLASLLCLSNLYLKTYINGKIYIFLGLGINLNMLFLFSVLNSLVIV